MAIKHRPTTARLSTTSGLYVTELNNFKALISTKLILNKARFSTFQWLF